MSTEIRQMDGDELVETLVPLQAYAFGRSPLSDADREREREQAAKAHWACRLVAFVDGRPRAAVVGLPMRQNIRGRVVPMLGIGGVATDPRARRRGLARALVNRVHAEFRDDGYVTAALWPFQASFYEKFGYVGWPADRKVRLRADGLERAMPTDLPGEVTLHEQRDVVDELLEFGDLILSQQHGRAMFDADRTRRMLTSDDRWVAVARTDTGIAGVLPYRTAGHGEEVDGRTLLYTDPLGRALLLNWLGAHVGQVPSFAFTVGASDRPELWFTDAQLTVESRIDFPAYAAPMVRFLSVDRLDGLPVAGTAAVTVRVVDDPLIAGTWQLDGVDGTLRVTPVSTGDASGDSAGGPGATVTAHGLAGLITGVLDPVELPTRGYGSADPAAAEGLRTLFPPASPFLDAHF